ASMSANRTGAQSAVRMPSATSGSAVAMPSPSCLAPKSQSAVTLWTVALWICARVTSRAPGAIFRHGVGNIAGTGAAIQAGIDASRDAAIAAEKTMRKACAIFQFGGAADLHHVLSQKPGGVGAEAGNSAIA